MTLCNHEYNPRVLSEVEKIPDAAKSSEHGPILCELEVGHIGNHRKYVTMSSTQDEKHYQFYEWNNNRQTRPVEYGAVFPCNYDSGVSELEKAVDQAITDAKAHLPKESVFEIRAKDYPPLEDVTVLANFGREAKTRKEIAEAWGLAWYAVPDIYEGFEDFATLREPLFRLPVDKGLISEVTGYVLIARVKA